MQTENKISIEQWTQNLLSNNSEQLLFDVRSPAEFAAGHIPGAQNLPLLGNEERHQVGLLYRQKGYEPAFDLALQLSQGNFSTLVQHVRQALSTRKAGTKPTIYCFRGGQRSASVSWLLEKARIPNTVLEGGYKKYRHFVLESFNPTLPQPRLILLGGKTGSGKSDLLEFYQQNGVQIIHLEQLAKHRGSAFGALGQGEQPSQEMFENELALKWKKLDCSKIVLVEAESAQIGRIRIPPTLKEQMEKAPRIQLDVPRLVRLKRITAEYAHFASNDLITCLNKIERKLGGLNFKNAVQGLQESQINTTLEIILDYYDKNYQFACKAHTGKVYPIDLLVEKDLYSDVFLQTNACEIIPNASPANEGTKYFETLCKIKIDPVLRQIERENYESQQ